MFAFAVKLKCCARIEESSRSSSQSQKHKMKYALILTATAIWICSGNAEDPGERATEEPRKMSLTCQRDYLEEARKMLDCLDEGVSITKIITDIQDTPQENLDEVFKKVCGKWRKEGKDCIRGFAQAINDCAWLPADNFTKVMEAVVTSLCGDNNEGSRLVSLVTDGGITCMRNRGYEVRECIFVTTREKLQPPLSRKDVSESLEKVTKCSRKGFGKCDKQTTQTLITSVIEQVEITVGFKVVQTGGITTTLLLAIIPSILLVISIIVAVICIKKYRKPVEETLPPPRQAKKRSNPRRGRGNRYR